MAVEIDCAADRLSAQASWRFDADQAAAPGRLGRCGHWTRRSRSSRLFVTPRLNRSALRLEIRDLEGTAGQRYSAPATVPTAQLSQVTDTWR